ncbi:MAG: rRNA maturation RNase YbeY [Planctomycetota bacterium]|nr:MAG: rRNA maturation RNase YbeY [Planctomycetota bacterium]
MKSLTKVMQTESEQQDIVVQIAKNVHQIEMCPAGLEKLVRATCRRFGVSKATVSIALLDDSEIRELNKRFLNRDYATDCLSFDLSDDGDSRTEEKGPVSSDKFGRSFEVVVNAEMAVREACARGHSSEAEVALYITHGLLHNLGFDDSAPDKAKEMHDTEDEILGQLGYGPIESS